MKDRSFLSSFTRSLWPVHFDPSTLTVHFDTICANKADMLWSQGIDFIFPSRSLWRRYQRARWGNLEQSWMMKLSKGIHWTHKQVYWGIKEDFLELKEIIWGSNYSMIKSKYHTIHHLQHPVLDQVLHMHQLYTLWPQRFWPIRDLALFQKSIRAILKTKI